MGNHKEFLENAEWEVLTPDGYQDFKGLSIGKNKVVKITLENGIELTCTADHKIFYTLDDCKACGEYVVGESVYTYDGIKKITDIKHGDTSTVYDLVDVSNGNRFYGDSVLVHNCLLIDECAFVADYIWDDFFNSVLPTISGGKKSKIIMVSTPKGMNHFYKIYRDAVQDPESNFRAIKIPWWERPDRDEEWKKRTLADMGQDLQKFQQEYGCQFLGSSNTLIDPEVLERTICKNPTDLKYGGAMRIYETPKPGEFYILGVDSAKGNGSDYSTIQVLKIESEHSITQVAVYRNNLIGPDEFAQLAIGISDYYNKAFMMVESNDIGELVVNKIWYDYECDRILNCDNKGLGIRATRKSKLAGNLLLKRYLENGWLEIVDDKTLYELSRYEEVSPNVFHAAGQNEHDDTVTSMIWALYYLTTVYYDKDDNSMSDVRKIDSKYRFEQDESPVFIGDNDNDFGSGTWEMY
jgi:hypothetical protein